MSTRYYIIISLMGLIFSTISGICNPIEAVDIQSDSKEALLMLSEPSDFEIDTEKYYSLIEKAKDTIPTSEFDKYRLKNFSRLQEGQRQFKYYLLEDLQLNSSFSSLLIAEYYESEQACWLVNYDKSGNIISSLEIFYDNAEGAWNTTSTIRRSDGFIKIREYDAYAEPNETVRLVLIDRSGKFIEK